MRLSILRSVFDSESPFATAYLAPAPAPGDPQELELRWRSLSKELLALGADADTVDAMSACIAPKRLLDKGLVIVGAGGRCLFEDDLHGHVTADRCRVSPLPDFAPYIRARISRTRQVIVVVDRTGADFIRRDGRNGDRPGNGWSRRRLQRTASQHTDEVAEAMAGALLTLAESYRPEVIVLTGDVDLRQQVRHDLPGSLERVLTVVDRDARDCRTANHLEELISEASTSSESAAHSKLRACLAAGRKNGRAVEGGARVIEELRHGTVEVLLLGEKATRQVPVGPAALQLWWAEGNEEAVARDRLDAAVIRAGSAIDAAVEPVDIRLRNGVAALLRGA